MNYNHKPFVILAAPSGSGKTTIVRHLLQDLSIFKFSISATTRTARAGEVDGKDYHFISVESFQKKIDEQAFLEWEMVYEGKYYGTLKSEIDNIFTEGKIPLLDIDVVGAANIKKLYGDKALTVFIKPPNLAVLEERLRSRGTDSDEVIQERVAKAEYELSYEKQFDIVIINDDLSIAIQSLKNVLSSHLGIRI